MFLVAFDGVTAGEQKRMLEREAEEAGRDSR
jgi:hypothetical protein